MDDPVLDQLSNLSNEFDQLQLMFERAPGFMTLLEGPDHKILIANKAFHELAGRTGLVGKTFASALPESLEQGIDEILESVARSGEPFVGHGMSLALTRIDGSKEDVLVDLVFQPVPPNDGHGPTIFVQGNNVTDDKRSEALRSAHNKVLELAIGDSPLETTIDRADQDR